MKRDRFWDQLYSRIYADLLQQYGGSPQYVAHMARDAADIALRERRRKYARRKH